MKDDIDIHKKNKVIPTRIQKSYNNKPRMQLKTT